MIAEQIYDEDAFSSVAKDLVRQDSSSLGSSFIEIHGHSIVFDHLVRSYRDDREGSLSSVVRFRLPRLVTSGHQELFLSGGNRAWNPEQPRSFDKRLSVTSVRVRDADCEEGDSSVCAIKELSLEKQILQDVARETCKPHARRRLAVAGWAVRKYEDALTRKIISLASEYGRYGYRRITMLLRGAGWRREG